MPHASEELPLGESRLEGCARRGGYGCEAMTSKAWRCLPRGYLGRKPDRTLPVQRHMQPQRHPVSPSPAALLGGLEHVVVGLGGA